jgi:hypothetical protein
MHGTRLLVGLVVVVAVPLVAASCGGSGDGGAPPTAPTSPPESKSSSTPPVTSAAPDPAASSPPAASAASASVAPPTPTGPAGPWPFGPVQTPEERSAQLERLKKDPGPIKSNWTPPGKGDRYGHAEGLISSPLDVVRGKLVDFTHYKDLAGPKFKSVKVVDKQGANTDVYFQLPIMKGLVTIWYITRFPPARAVPGADVVEGTYVKGNIKSMHIAFTLRPGPDDKSSVLVCDLVLQPNVPAPQSALDEELRDACGDAINSLRRTLGGS